MMHCIPLNLKPAGGTDEVGVQHVADSGDENNDRRVQNDGISDDPTSHAL